MKKTIIRRTLADHSLDEIDIHPLLKKIYAARGVTSCTDLEKNLEALLPFSELKGIEQAIACLYDALVKKQHILVLGDFDADGATSTALAVEALQAMGAAQVSYLVPNRFQFGYGLTPEIVLVANEKKPDLLITVDNGISSIEGVVKAKELGMKVLITDHHLQGSALPSADAIVNPNQHGDHFASKSLAGVGVIFYVMLALRAYLRQINWFVAQQLPEPNMAALLDLVALGTIADVVPLDKNNRILVHQGIKRIQLGKARPGIQALIQVAKRQTAQLVAADLGFAIAPRLNAAGRLEDMSLGIACLLSKNVEEAIVLAQRLDTLNKERRDIEMNMQRQAENELRHIQHTQHLPLGLCLYDERWHLGVVGIIASRIKDQLHRPVIAFAKMNEHELKGSGRSVPGLHIRDVLEAIATQQPHLIHKFGGHAMAAGVSLEPQQLTAFSNAFAAEVAKHLSEDNLQNKVFSDGELQLEEFKVEIAQLLRESSPWGQNFPEPLFDNCFTVLQQHIVGSKHLKMLVSLPGIENALFQAIAFNIDVNHWPNHQVKKIQAAYKLDVNEFRGQKNLQLIIEHFEIAV